MWLTSFQPPRYLLQLALRGPSPAVQSRDSRMGLSVAFLLLRPRHGFLVLTKGESPLRVQRFIFCWPYLAIHWYRTTPTLQDWRTYTQGPSHCRASLPQVVHCLVTLQKSYSQLIWTGVHVNNDGTRDLLTERNPHILGPWTAFRRALLAQVSSGIRRK